jgi:hypothetical protein
MIACNPDSNKNSATKLYSKNTVSSLLGHEYTSDASSKDIDATSVISFSDQNKFQINSFFAYENKQESSGTGMPSSTSSCEIEGEVTELANDLLLLTQIESNSDGKKHNVRIVMTLKLSDDKIFELNLIHPGEISDVCQDAFGSNGGLAIIGKYTKTK